MPSKNNIVGVKLISLDFDDTLYDLMKLNVDYINKKYNIPDIDKSLKSYYQLYKEYPSITENLWNSPDEYSSGDLIDGALDFYRKLVSKYGEESIQIVTSSMPNVVDIKNKMIKERFGIYCDVKHSIFNIIPKHELTGYTILVDDHIDNVISHLEYNDANGIIFNHMKLEYIKEKSQDIVPVYKKIDYADNFDLLYGLIKNKIKGN